MKKALAILLAIILMTAVAGCGEKNSTYTMELESNPSTGYTWECTADREGIVTEESHDYVLESEEPGAKGNEVFVFKGASEGDVELTFRYVRVWEDDEAEVEEPVTVSLHVDSEGYITVNENK